MSCGQDAGDQTDGDGYYFGQEHKVLGDMYRGRAGKLKCRSWAMPMPRNRPARLPMAASIMASPRNRLWIWDCRAPNARSRPISLVRSLTAMVIMVTIPIAPTSKEIPPMAVTARVSILSTELNTSSICCWVVIVTSSLPCLALRVRLIPFTTRSTVVFSRYSTSISCRLSRLNKGCSPL